MRDALKPLHMGYRVDVPGDRPVFFPDWAKVEAYLYLLEMTDWNAYMWATITECS